MRNTVNLSRWVLFGVVAFGLMVSAVDAQSRSRSRSRRSANDGPFTTGSSGEIVKFINERIRQNWSDNEVGSSPIAEDSEWIRRVHLDIVGHIPEADVVESFLKDDDPAKRSKMIDKLLDDDAYVRNFTTVWTNLCIGRQTPRRVSRAGMQKFFREAFARNRPWDEVVYDIISAEGHFEENGAVNFLLAQMTMRDEQVQATAKTTRLFMGIQVQCTQCHNHPFNDWQQSQFWQFNSFFRQARRVDHRKPDPETGRMVDDYSEIVFQNFNYPVFYEKRNGLMQMADPAFMGDVVTKAEAINSETNLRESLAKIAIEGENPLYLPQAKTFDECACLGPCLFVPNQPLGPDTGVELSISRGEEKVFSGSTSLAQMKRTPEELVGFLFRETSFASGVFLMTGTGIVPGTDFTLSSGDVVSISIDSIGVLTNPVR